MAVVSQDRFQCNVVTSECATMFHGLEWLFWIFVEY